MSRRAKNTVPQTRKKRPSARHAPPRPRPRNLRPTAKRATRPLLMRLFSPLSLAELPIALADDAVYPPCPKHRFRSWYRPRSPQAIRRYWAARKAQPAQSAAAHFEAAFYLLDFSPLRPRLAHLTLTASAQGEAPFDPLSLLLATWIKIALGLPWTALADLLAHPAHGARWRRLCGFRDGDTPAVATLRIFRDRLASKQEAPAPPQEFNAFHRLFLANLDRLGLLPDPAATHGYTLAGDGQRHRARSRHRCHHAVAACFQEHTREQPRACPAQETSKGRYGCACDTDACRERCALAPRWDPQAGYSVYSREKAGAAKNAPATDETANPTAPAPDGVEGVWGYRSLAARLVDPRLHVAWNVYTEVHPANADEGTCFPHHLEQTCAHLPTPDLGYVLYDSACGEQPCLDAVYDRGGIPLFALQGDPSDDDPVRVKERGYDARGYPLCHQGFRMTWQGLDRSHCPPRARWVCQHACRQSEEGAVADCAYLPKKRGQYRYVQRTLPEGNYRLARLIPPGSRRWKEITGWRNTSEGRNSALEQKGLKRLPDYGLPHGAFLIGWADGIENLCTLTRLVLEATVLDARVQPQEPAPRPPCIRVENGRPLEEEAAEEGEDLPN